MAGSPQHLTLVAGQISEVDLGKDYARIEILNRDGSAEVYFTVDGSDPVVGGIGSQVLPAAICDVEIAPRDTGGPHSGRTLVRLISAGTPSVSVRGL